MKRSLVFVLVILFSGCANISKVSNIEVYDRNSSYLYGALKLVRENVSVASMALEFENVSTSDKYLVKFDSDGEVFTLKVTPGEYRISGFHALGAFDYKNGYKKLDIYPYTTNFEVKPGEAIYIGEHLGVFKVIGQSMLWSVKFQEDLFDERTSSITDHNGSFDMLNKRRAF